MAENMMNQAHKATNETYRENYDRIFGTKGKSDNKPMVLHGFDGSCRPGGPSDFLLPSQSTFSVGIFPILPKVNGSGTKRGPVKVRVKGSISNPEPVYAKALEIMDLLDAGKYNGPKNVKI